MEQIDKEPVPEGLRDQIAIEAMRSYLATCRMVFAESNLKIIAEGSYLMADAMLKARKETKTE